MTNQKGAALIVVLSLLVGSLVIGLSSMQSSLVDERLAGNQKLSSEVQMAAERAASIGFEKINNVSLLMPILRGGCSLTDLFPKSQRDELAWSLFEEERDAWENMLQDVVESGKPCEGYSDAWLNNSGFDASDFDFEEMYGAFLSDVSGLCEAHWQCEYRYVSDENGLYVVGMGAYFEGGQLLAKSRPVVVELVITPPSPDVDWIFSAPPISFLTYISDLVINGANNMKINGGDADVMAHGENVAYLYKEFSNRHNDDPTVCSLPGTFGGEGSGVCTSDSDDFANEDAFVSILQLLVDASSRSDNIDYHKGDLKMRNHSFDTAGNDSGKILVVGGNFEWNGRNDFEGTIIVLGPSITYNGGGNGDLHGSLIHAPLKLTNPDYDWLTDGEFVDFNKVENFTVGDWRFLQEFDSVSTAFDFNGGGTSILRNDADAQMEAADEFWSAISNAKFIAWESD